MLYMIDETDQQMNFKIEVIYIAKLCFIVSLNVFTGEL